MRKAQPGGGCAFLEYTDRYNSTFDILYQNFQQSKTPVESKGICWKPDFS